MCGLLVIFIYFWVCQTVSDGGNIIHVRVCILENYRRVYFYLNTSTECLTHTAKHKHTLSVYLNVGGSRSDVYPARTRSDNL